MSDNERELYEKLTSKIENELCDLENIVFEMISMSNEARRLVDSLNKPYKHLTKEQDERLLEAMEYLEI